jgi:hypothetical protein
MNQEQPPGPYKDSAINLIYNLLFCDDLNLFKTNTKLPYNYPFEILFSETSSVIELQKITDDINSDPRIKVFACNKQIADGHTPTKKELFAVIVEIGLNEGLDVLASFNNGTARYINHSGKLLVWEITTDETANRLMNDLFVNSSNIVKQIGPWNKPRRPPPETGNTRITFLMSDGLYFGEALTGILFNDLMAAPALASATALLKYLTEKVEI